MFDRVRKMRKDDGFTLVELLIVIVILGILAAVVVVAVSGINDRGQASACQTDAQSIRTAQEAYWSQKGSYADGQPTLVEEGFLSSESTLHETGSPDGGSTFTVTPLGSTCA